MMQNLCELFWSRKRNEGQKENEISNKFLRLHLHVVVFKALSLRKCDKNAKQ